LDKVIRSMSVLALASLATWGMAPSAFAEDPYYSNEDGANIYVDSCDGVNFSVTIDGTEYGPGDVASGFSLSSTYSVSAGAGVTVGWVPASVVQGSFGHGLARTPLENSENFDASGAYEWITISDSFLSIYPSIFYAECPGSDRYAYIQIFPGLSLEDAGFDFNLEEGVYLSDQAQLDSLGLSSNDAESGVLFAPMSNFRNSAYAFWVNYLESFILDNDDVRWSFSIPLEGDYVQGVWAYVFLDEEFASTYYSYSDGSVEESNIGDVFEEEGASPSTPSAPATTTPATTTPATTTPAAKLAATGANVEWLLVAGILVAIAGSGFIGLSRRKRIW
jgi:LPXTG-motif cell wall-anchored protein